MKRLKSGLKNGRVVDMKLSEKILLVSLVVLIAAVVLWVMPPLQSAERSLTNVKPLTPGYIDDSRIFLLSSNSSYGSYYGSPCFIIGVTVRNDYTAQQPVPDNTMVNDSGLAWFILTAKLYDKNGTMIDSQSLLPPSSHPNYDQVSLVSGGTFSLNINMATTRRDVDRYDLDFGYLGALPAP
jgi:hypothetical protein